MRCSSSAPENVAPLVGWLASPLAHNVSGQVFVIWAKQVSLANAPRLRALRGA